MNAHIVGTSLFLPNGVRSRLDLGRVLYDDAGNAHRATVFEENELEIDFTRFRISPRQARVMDPQHLLIQDCVQRALEDAGYAPGELAGSRTGVFLGMTESDFIHTLDIDGVREANRSYVGIGNNRGAAAGRVSYTLNLRGPSWTVDTSCSSGIVALQHGIAAIANGDADRSIVIASHLVRSDYGRMIRSTTGALSSSDRCRAFEEDADGFTIGEGVIALVLEPAGTNVRSLGRVHCALNHDGRTSGLTVPNGKAQRDVIRRALAASGLPSAAVTYVEAHGTGTPLGDPIEVEALADGYETAARLAPLLIGSNKPVFGHLEAASGLLSILVAIETLRRQRPPQMNSAAKQSSLIPWQEHNIRAAFGDVDPAGPINHVGVSSFGLSGTNGHAIVSRAVGDD